MPRVSEMQDYQSKFLKAADLGGRAVRVQIATADEQTMKQQDGTSQRKIVLGFTGKAKQLVLNKSNAQNLAAGLGDDSDDWIGAEIVLTPTRTNNGIDTINAMAIPLANGAAPRTAIAQQAQRRPVAVQAAVQDAPEWPDRDYDTDQDAGGVDGEGYDPNIPF